MEKYVYQLTDFAHRIKKGDKDYVNSDNLKSFTLPDVEPGSNEVKGYSGLNGTIQIIDWANIAALEISLKFSTIPECYSALMSPDRITHEFSWVEEYTDKDQNKGWIRNRVYATGMLKKIPGGDYSKGESGEREFVYAANTYKMTRYITVGEEQTEQVIINYDPINKILVLGGEDFGEKLKTAMASF